MWVACRDTYACWFGSVSDDHEATAVSGEAVIRGVRSDGRLQPVGAGSRPRGQGDSQRQGSCNRVRMSRHIRCRPWEPKRLELSLKTTALKEHVNLAF